MFAKSWQGHLSEVKSPLLMLTGSRIMKTAFSSFVWIAKYQFEFYHSVHATSHDWVSYLLQPSGCPGFFKKTSGQLLVHQESSPLWGEEHQTWLWPTQTLALVRTPPFFPRKFVLKDAVLEIRLLWCHKGHWFCCFSFHKRRNALLPKPDIQLWQR